jgi:hypothetical protein
MAGGHRCPTISGGENSVTSENGSRARGDLTPNRKMNEVRATLKEQA